MNVKSKLDVALSLLVMAHGEFIAQLVIFLVQMPYHKTTVGK